MKNSIAYQNKDITSNVLAEQLKGKSFRVYGLELPDVERVPPTNIPAVKANELRLDSIFELADGSAAIVDYESEYRKEDKVKYLNYLTGIAGRYLAEKLPCPKRRMIVIYTGDIKRGQVETVYDIGAVNLKEEPAFLSELDFGSIFTKLKEKWIRMSFWMMKSRCSLSYSRCRIGNGRKENRRYQKPWSWR